MRLANIRKRRVIAVCIIFLAFAVFAARMISVQIVNGDYYANIAGSAVKSNIEVKAARGEILDRNGSPLVINRQGNCLIFDAAYFPSKDKQKERNEIIISLINLVESHGEEWIDSLPLVFGADGKIAYKEDSDAEINFLRSKDMLHLNSYATAQNCFDALIKEFELSEYSAADARKIASVCFGLKFKLFSVNNPYTFAEDVSTETVAKVKENSSFYKGIDIEVVPYREYIDGTFAPHVIGRVAPLDADEYKALKDKGYKMNDLIGKEGIEEVMEEYLRGKSGKKTVKTDAKGNVSTAYTEDPVQGNTVVLTIEKNIQLAAQKAAQEVVDKLVARGYVNSAASAVVLKVDDGSVLACASYPTFDISRYSKDFDELNKDERRPLWNRALRSAYAPGSTFKVAMGLAGLEEGILTESTTFRCTGAYWRFPNQFFCLENNGNINVTHALEHSCNVFFYETGYQLGIERMNYYCSKLGFGQVTGCELPESEGVLANPEEFAQAHPGDSWKVGDTVQAAIGQSDNLVTPMQLANYCLTIANGGTRLVPHFVKSVKSYDYTSTVLEKGREVAAETGFSQENINIVKHGMSLVPKYSGSATHSILGSYVPQVACKTGTAQVYAQKNGKNQLQQNCFLIAFAPYDDPQIALAICVEDAPNSSHTATIAKAIFDEYFSNTSNLDIPQNAGQLIL